MRKFSYLYLFFVLFFSSTLVMGLYASSAQSLNSFVSAQDLGETEDADTDELVNQAPMEEELIHENFAEYLTPPCLDFQIAYPRYLALSSQHFPLGMIKPPNA